MKNDKTIAATTSDNTTVVIAQTRHLDLTAEQTSPTGIVVHLDPSVLVIESNVRPSAPVTREFIEDIRRNGVLMPIRARRDENGNVLVRAGQRRTLAAREAGLTTMPVYVVDSDDTTTERIFEQLAENEQRLALTDGDRAAAYQQLVFEGLSIPAIAKRTGVKSSEVKTAVTVAENQLAASAVQTHALTLDQAATLIEFEGDDSTVDKLIDTATNSPSQFAHVAQRARDDRARAAARAEAEAKLTEAGYVVLTSQPGYYDTDYTPLTDLIDSEGNKVTDDHITGVEGRAAHVNVYGRDDVTIRYYLSDPKKAGFRKATSSSNAGGPMTDEQKAERRTLIANNKAWLAAETVRRGWLTTFLSRKTLPKDSIPFIAQALTDNRNVVSSGLSSGNNLAHTLLGIERESGFYAPDKLATLATAFPAKATHVALAIVIGGIEDATGKHTWRNPSRNNASYFRQLATWGYGLSEVERIVADHKKSRLMEAVTASNNENEDGKG